MKNQPILILVVSLLITFSLKLYAEDVNKIEINIFENNSLGLDDYEIEFLSKTNKTIEKIEKISNLKKLEVIKPEVKNFSINKKKFKKKKFQKRKNYKKKLN